MLCATRYPPPRELSSARHRLQSSYSIPEIYTNRYQLICTAHPRLHPLHPPHPQRLTPTRTPCRNGRVDFEGNTFPVRNSPSTSYPATIPPGSIADKCCSNRLIV
jgi:hypothetical protein